MKHFITLCLLFSSSFSFAQAWFKPEMQGKKVPGWIVTTSGDTLRGQIQYNNPGIMSYKVYFWADSANADRQKFKGKDLKGYFFENVYWESINFNDGSIKLTKDQSAYSFARPVIKGRLCIYEVYTLVNSKLLEQEGNTITVLPTELETGTYLRKDEGAMEGLSHIKFMNFKKAMGKIVEDCPTVAAKVENKEYGRFQLQKIVTEYNETCGK